MSTDLLEDLLDRLIADLPPSTGVNLRGFEMDASVLFTKSRFLCDIRLSSSEDPRELVRLRVLASRRAKTLGDVMNGLLEGSSRICYSHFHADSLTCFENAARLRFVAVPNTKPYFVSGTAFVVGEHYRQLVAANHIGPPRRPITLPDWAS